MENEANLVVAEILGAEDEFLIQLGRVTLSFSSIEDRFVQDARRLADLTHDEELKAVAMSQKIEQLRMLEKRDFLKRVIAELGRFYDIDHSRVSRLLNEFGEINRLRRTECTGGYGGTMQTKRPF